MFKLCLAAIVFCSAIVARAEHYQEYGKYDLSTAFKRTNSAAGNPKYRINVRLIDQVFDDLATHAKHYPPKFSSDEEKSRAVRDATALVALFDELAADHDAKPALLLRAAFVSSIAHNLDISDAGPKAIRYYERLLRLEPDNPRTNLSYGIFLAGTGTLQKKSLPYLEKALRLGDSDARYTLGLVHLSLGENDKAVAYLEAYAKTRPYDKRPKEIIAAIRAGRIKFGKGP